MKDILSRHIVGKLSVILCNMFDVVTSLGSNDCNVQLQSVVFDVNVILDGAVVKRSSCLRLMSQLLGLPSVRKCLLKPHLSCLTIYL